MGAVLIPIIVLIIFVLVINMLQDKRPNWLPKSLQNWKFLPEHLRSLDPYDKYFSYILCCKTCKKVNAVVNVDEDTESIRTTKF